MPTPPTKSNNPVPNKERIKMPRQHMPEQPPQIRNKQFTEVNLGYSAELARQEALRCLECAKPTCTARLPGRRESQRFCATDCRRRLHGRGREDSRR